MAALGPGIREIAIYAVDFVLIKDIFNLISVKTYENKVFKLLFLLLCKCADKDRRKFFYPDVVDVGISFCTLDYELSISRADLKVDGVVMEAVPALSFRQVILPLSICQI